MKKYLIAGAALIAIAAVAGPIKVWSNGEILSSSDLNAALAHLHASVGHGHGPVITNADISASAGIAQSKIAFSIPLPKALFQVGTSAGAPCTSGTCTLVGTNTSQLGTLTVTRASAGNYNIAWTTALTDANYYPIFIAGAASSSPGCYQAGRTTTSIAVVCYTITTATPPVNAAADMMFGVVLYDDN